MADTEMQILITAVDNVSATMNRIEKKLENSNKNIQKQTDKTANAFDKQMGSLLVLGQAANTVDNIFSSYQNLQIRVENSTERLANAQDRLRKAQYNLTKVQQDTSKSALDIANAQADVESANRGLIISQNNLARSNNMVLGTYISIGIQTATLIRQLPILIIEIKALTASSLAFVATPLGASMVALGASIAIVTYQTSQLNKQQEEINKINEESVTNIKAIADAYKSLYDNTSRTERSVKGINSAIAEMYGFSGNLVSEKEATMLVSIAEGEKKISDLRATRAQQISSGYDITIIDAQIAKIQEEQDVLQTRYDTEITAANNVFNAQNVLRTSKELADTNSQKRINEFYNKSYTEQLTFMKDVYYKTLNDIKQADFNADMSRLNDLISKQRELNEARAQSYAQSNILKEALDKAPTALVNTINNALGIGSSKSKNDFVSRPGQAPISFSKDDTLIGVKDVNSLGGRGMTLIIEGNIYGTDPDEMAEALYDKLRRKISF